MANKYRGFQSEWLRNSLKVRETKASLSCWAFDLMKIDSGLFYEQMNLFVMAAIVIILLGWINWMSFENKNRNMIRALINSISPPPNKPWRVKQVLLRKGWKLESKRSHNFRGTDTPRCLQDNQMKTKLVLQGESNRLGEGI